MNEPWGALLQSVLGQMGRKVLERLNAAGHPSYFVGGCVRDSLLGRGVKDIDIATAATPQEVMELYPDAIPTGLQHGTVTVKSGGCLFEVTTFRSESEYVDGRRPESVAFIDSIERDLERRDFTMNAMALSPEGRLVDPYGGQQDLEQRVLRCVGEPGLRFGEDALRMLRCVRFAAEYGLAVDPPTWREVQDGAAGLSRIAMERVRSELERMLSGADPFRALRLLQESELLRWTKERLRFPRSLGLKDAGDARNSEPLEDLLELSDPLQRWMLWFLRMQLSPHEAYRALVDALRGSKAFGTEVQQLLALHGSLSAAPIEHADAAWKSSVLSHGKETAVLWLPIAQPLSSYSEYKWTSPYAEHGQQWLQAMPVTGLSELAVDGRIVMETVRKKGGPWLSHLLQRLLTETAMNKTPNEKDALLARAVELAAEEGEQR